MSNTFIQLVHCPWLLTYLVVFVISILVLPLYYPYYIPHYSVLSHTSLVLLDRSIESVNQEVT